MGKTGRKPKYEYWIEDEGLFQVEMWAREGLTDKQIAKNIGISEYTLYDWRRKFPKFLQALKKNKDWADQQIENALYKRAHGFEYEEETQELRFDKSLGQYVMKTTKKIKKYCPPDNVAMIFWLKNRQPRKWRDQRNIELSDGNGQLAALIDGLKETKSDE